MGERTGTTSTPKIATAQSTIILGSSRVSCSMPHLLKGLPTCFGIPSPRPQLLIAPCLSCPQKEPIWLCRACFLSSRLIRKSQMNGPGSSLTYNSWVTSFSQVTYAFTQALTQRKGFGGKISGPLLNRYVRLGVICTTLGFLPTSFIHTKNKPSEGLCYFWGSCNR